ncbi:MULTISPECIES: hypothetical protein [Mumia]|uniref:hypothetical protein n=1 Tax=Mumia TaxID=1546255 RepID=UPI00141ED8A9|nr:MULTISPECIES: hypothetical protein [unclassified Mumia]QMW65558.1 hypothetical protein H4N58_15400 [Mumia sp. ZJ1417]
MQDHVVRLVDLAVGATVAVAVPLVGAARALAPGAIHVGRRLAYPPLVPLELAPGTVARLLVVRGRATRLLAQEVLVQRARAAVPVVVDEVLDQIDLTRLVLNRVDLAHVVVTALDELNLTAVVTEHVDLGQVVSTALDQLDLTEVVLDRVDLQRVVTHVLDGLDLTALVRERVDLDALANEVIDDVDLPEIIRDSSSGIAADLVIEARTGAATADEVVARAVDRVLVWRRRREGGPR